MDAYCRQFDQNSCMTIPGCGFCEFDPNTMGGGDVIPPPLYVEDPIYMNYDGQEVMPMNSAPRNARDQVAPPAPSKPGMEPSGTTTTAPNGNDGSAGYYPGHFPFPPMRIPGQCMAGDRYGPFDINCCFKWTFVLSLQANNVECASRGSGNLQ